MNGGAMLNAYPDSLGGTLSDIAQLLESEAFADAFRSFYILRIWIAVFRSSAMI